MNNKCKRHNNYQKNILIFQFQGIALVKLVVYYCKSNLETQIKDY